ncbi:MAG: cysteine--tRNA ligase [Clostridia bacterium]
MIRFYNTLSRTKEEFVPIKEEVGIYSCGPTVYKYAHAGNMRAYVFVDTLVRTLKYFGYKVKSVMNITDVGHLLSDADTGEDKMAKSAKEEHKSPLEIAKFYTNAFFKDFDSLNNLRPVVVPHATDNIKEMIAIVVDLLSNGYAYETEDGIYFDISKFAGYGKLSGINLDEQLSGARVEVNSGKRHPADFALWKKATPNHIMQWDSPWGKGFPGWHIECTAMSKKYLGEVFDIHTGGVDHIPIHHENEIAQSECWLGKKTVNYWLHNEWMLFEGGKMSKSLNNGYTVTDFTNMGYSAMAFRYFCLNTHYRQKLNFSFEALTASQTAYDRLIATLYAHKQASQTTGKEVIDKYLLAYEEAISDDLNIPMALGIMYKAIKEPKSKDIFDLIVKMDTVFGLNLAKAEPKQEELTLPEEVIDLLSQRKLARQNKDFASADKLRDKLLELGYVVKDTLSGQVVDKVK